MSEEQTQSGEITERFRAFARSVDPEPRRVPRSALLVAGTIVLLGAVAIIFMMFLP